MDGYDEEYEEFTPQGINQFDEYEALTSAEIAQERRRKAAARRRKMAAREARRRKRRREAIIRCSILLLIVILLIVGIVKMISGIWNHFHDKPKKSSKVTEEMQPSTEETTQAPIVADIDEAILAKDLPTDREAAIDLLKIQAATDPELQTLMDNVAVYPDYILLNLAVNPEMKQFAINYPTKINILFDGDFNVDYSSDSVPLFLQFDEEWGYADYGQNIIGITGAGPTCLSMAYTYLKQDGSQNPIKVADFATEMGYLDEDGDTSWALITQGAVELGLGTKELTGGEDEMITALKGGNLIICSVTPGDFTKSSHFILIKEYKEGLFYLNDPSSEARSQVGWDYARLESQIAKMWVISANATANSGQDNGNDSTTDSTNPQGTDDSTGNDTNTDDGTTIDAQQANEADTNQNN